MEQRARLHRPAPRPVLSRAAAAHQNRTKIVATIGPASRTPEVLRQLIEAGVDVFRLNFSHGTHEEHSAVLADIRRISAEMDRQVAVLAGPGRAEDPARADPRRRRGVPPRRRVHARRRASPPTRAS